MKYHIILPYIKIGSTVTTPFKTDSVFTLHIYYTILVLKSQRFFLKIENLKVLYHFFRKKINIYVQIAQEFFLLLSDRAAKYLLAEM